MRGDECLTQCFERPDVSLPVVLLPLSVSLPEERVEGTTVLDQATGRATDDGPALDTVELCQQPMQKLRKPVRIIRQLTGLWVGFAIHNGPCSALKAANARREGNLVRAG